MTKEEKENMGHFLNGDGPIKCTDGIFGYMERNSVSYKLMTWEEILKEYPELVKNMEAENVEESGKNKYYTPELEEFRVGFEFEDSTNSEEEDWVQWYIADINDLVGALELYNYHKCRVKYLDREDIESLGFEHTDKLNESFNTTDFNLDQWELSIWNDIERGSISIEKKNLVGVNTVHFVGTIKNKSELKRLLKQLGI